MDLTSLLMGAGAFLLGAGATGVGRLWQAAMSARELHLEGKRAVGETLASAASQMKDCLVLLESEKPEIRIGALHQLGMIARSVRAFHEPIMDVACAYVRRNAVDRGLVSDDEIAAREPLLHRLDQAATSDGSRSVLEAAPDVDVALRIIGACGGADDARFKRNLSRCDLRKYAFYGDFSRVNFRFSRLDGALFDSTNVTLALFWSTSMRWTTFANANAAEATFLSCKLEQAAFDRCNLELARFSETDLAATEIKDCQIRDLDLGSSAPRGWMR